MRSVRQKEQCMKLSKVTGTSCRCRFHLEDGRVAAASSEFTASPDGRFTGQHVYAGSLKFEDSGEFLTEAERDELRKEFERWRKTRASKFTLEFIE